LLLPESLAGAEEQQRQAPARDSSTSGAAALAWLSPRARHATAAVFVVPDRGCRKKQRGALAAQPKQTLEPFPEPTAIVAADSSEKAMVWHINQ